MEQLLVVRPFDGDRAAEKIIPLEPVFLRREPTKDLILYILNFGRAFFDLRTGEFFNSGPLPRLAVMMQWN